MKKQVLTHARFGFVSLVSTTLLVCLLASATPVKAQQPGWSATGSLGTARIFGHRAALLANGKVLVVGGMGGKPYERDLSASAVSTIGEAVGQEEGAGGSGPLDLSGPPRPLNSGVRLLASSDKKAL